MQRTTSSTGIDRVQIEATFGGMSSIVWLRRNIEQCEDEQGNPVFTADEVCGMVSPMPTVDEIDGDFDAWWDKLEDASKTDAERVAELTARLDKAERRAELLESAVVELAGLYGGE